MTLVGYASEEDHAALLSETRPASISLFTKYRAEADRLMELSAHDIASAEEHRLSGFDLRFDVNFGSADSVHPAAAFGPSPSFAAPEESAAPPRTPEAASLDSRSLGSERTPAILSLERRLRELLEALETVPVDEPRGLFGDAYDQHGDFQYEEAELAYRRYAFEVEQLSDHDHYDEEQRHLSYVARFDLEGFASKPWDYYGVLDDMRLWLKHQSTR